MPEYVKKKSQLPEDLFKVPKNSANPWLSFLLRHARNGMSACLLMSDIFSLLLAFGLAIALRTIIFGRINFSIILGLLPFFVLFIFFYAWRGLYPGVGLSPVDEMSLLSGATNIVFLILIAITFLEQTSEVYSRFVLVIAWLLALVLVQLDRWLIRILGRTLGFWGEPVVVVGDGPGGSRIFKYLNQNIRLGMRPMCLVNGHSALSRRVSTFLQKMNIHTAILVMPEMSVELQKHLVNDQLYGLQRLILISSLGWVGSLGVIPHDLDGVLGLEVSQNLLSKGANIIKRWLDLVLSGLFVVLSSPVLLLMMVLIKLDSPGGAFYQQVRIGRYGRKFKMWKFRTMVLNADRQMEKHLAANPALKAEWEAKQKLKNDPRITRMGRFLRKFSLDEIPQLVNVIKGEMSLVGPRPYFPAQQKIYGSTDFLYKRVRPGMTGMWQVLGRNATSFAERVRLDEYYVRNWSIYLDFYIIVRTVIVVLRREGAY